MRYVVLMTVLVCWTTLGWNRAFAADEPVDEKANQEVADIVKKVLGEYGIELRIKMMTKPGEQGVIRRKAYVAIKKAFEEAGIKIPIPTVMVREGESPAAAAAALQQKLKDEAEAKAAAAS